MRAVRTPHANGAHVRRYYVVTAEKEKAILWGEFLEYQLRAPRAATPLTLFSRPKAPSHSQTIRQSYFRVPTVLRSINPHKCSLVILEGTEGIPL